MADLSVVIPVLNDFDALRAGLAALPPQHGIEIIVVDGGNDPRLSGLADGRTDVRLMHADPGRGAQMNAGARVAAGDWLLFLHADCMLPTGWSAAIRGLPPSRAGGWFTFSMASESWRARVLEQLVRWRVRVFGLAYGDQGIFVRREVFERLGGFREWPLMEDVDLVRRLRRSAPVATLPLAVRSSARRWERDGWIRRSGRNVCLLLLYFVGVSPTRLARWY